MSIKENLKYLSYYFFYNFSIEKIKLSDVKLIDLNNKKNEKRFKIDDKFKMDVTNQELLEKWIEEKKNNQRFKKKFS